GEACASHPLRRAGGQREPGHWFLEDARAGADPAGRGGDVARAAQWPLSSWFRSWASPSPRRWWGSGKRRSAGRRRVTRHWGCGRGGPGVVREPKRATLDAPAPAAGTIAAIAHGEGDTVKIGEVLGTIAAGASASASAPVPAPSVAAVAPPRAPAVPAAQAAP